MDKRLLDELSARLAGLMPAANELRHETRSKVEQVLKNGLKELDMLTRDEFDTQARALGQSTAARHGAGKTHRESRVTACHARATATSELRQPTRQTHTQSPLEQLFLELALSSFSALSHAKKMGSKEPIF